MACLVRKLPFRSFLCCCDISPENICCIIGSVCLFFAFNHLCNFIPFFCLATAIPHTVIMLLFAVGGGLLIGGVAFDRPNLLVIFPWIMIACIVMEVIYGVLIYHARECLSSVLILLFSDSAEGSVFVGLIFGYVLIGFMTGIDFVFCLYALLLISCVLTEVVTGINDRCEMSTDAD